MERYFHGISIFIIILSVSIFLSIFKVIWPVILFYWFINLKDIIRETSKKCNFIPLDIFIFIFIIIIFSEIILFFIIFWIIFHFILSNYYYIIILYIIFIPDPCELTYGTTFLLSNAGISLSSILINRDSLGLFYWNNFSSFIYSWLFLSIQINEFRYLGFYINDSELGCIYIFLSGLHFFHILYGILILGINSNSTYSIEILLIDTISLDLYFIIQILYWHFIEFLWLLLYIIYIIYYIYILYYIIIILYFINISMIIIIYIIYIIL